MSKIPPSRRVISEGSSNAQALARGFWNGMACHEVLTREAYIKLHGEAAWSEFNQELGRTALPDGDLTSSRFGKVDRQMIVSRAIGADLTGTSPHLKEFDR